MSVHRTGLHKTRIDTITEAAEADGRRTSQQDGSGVLLASLPSWLTPVAAPIVALLPQLSRYTVVSALALALDLGLFLALTRGVGVKAAFAGVVGYSAGLVLHYILSTRFVFDTGSSAKSQARMFAEFAATGLVGVGITWAVIAAGTEFALLPDVVAKAAAVGTSFFAVFLLRRTMVFTRAAAA